ncbi:unnamed protein product, partial [Brenthis ino]
MTNKNRNMSDSSEEEDLSRFREAVDTTFVKFINDSKNQTPGHSEKNDKPRSERYLEESTHYNDIKVPDELQNRIGAKVSALIAKNIEFINIEGSKIKKRKIKGGVKLFKNSECFLSCEEVKDTDTELHNMKSKKIHKHKKRQVDKNIEELSEIDKVNAVAVSGEHVLSKEDTKYWKSRRKEKIFKYKSSGKSKVLVAIE